MSNIEEIQNSISIPQWYSGKNIFITGSTGFMGKVLVEKLLRDCPDVKCLYLLIRTKKGVEPIQRKEDYLNCVIFDKIRQLNPKQFEKIRVIKGDVLQDELGIDENEKKEIISNVNVIFHCAANVRFDLSLRDAVEMNTVGTERVLKLAQKMVDLNVLIHVSTCYCHCNEDVVEERAYPASHNPTGIIHMIRSLDDELLEQITPRLLNGLPNTYAYTKGLTEGLIATYGDKIPIIVCRPSIVTAVRKEPLPGWVEGLNGPTGLMIGAARGVIRTMHCNPDYPSDLIPVDTAINAMIVAGWERANMNSNKTEFINVCLSHKNLPTWGENLETARRIFYKNPLCFSLWYPDGSIKSNYYHHLLAVLFFHYLPAYFIDMILVVIGQKPFLVRVQKKVSVGLKVLQYYTTKIWVFNNDKLESLRFKLNPCDQVTFDLTVDQINWETYLYDMIMGMRVYLLKESPETIPKARKILRRLYILDRTIVFLFYGFLFWFLWTYLEIILNSVGSFLNICSSFLVR